MDNLFKNVSEIQILAVWFVWFFSWGRASGWGICQPSARQIHHHTASVGIFSYCIQNPIILVRFYS